MAFSWEDARSCSTAQVSREYKARYIRDGIILKTERWVLHDFPDAEAATEGKCVAASEKRSEE
jgi:hypothetical protein